MSVVVNFLIELINTLGIIVIRKNSNSDRRLFFKMKNLSLLKERQEGRGMTDVNGVKELD